MGRVVARDGSALDVEFPRRQQQTLAVGARVPIALCDARRGAPAEDAIPDRSCVATERSEQGDKRRYRLQLDDAADGADRRVGAGARDRTPPRGRALRVDLRFGMLDFRAEVAAWPGGVIVLRVALETEALLRERRILEGLFVRYDFRIDDQLAEDGALQRVQLRSLLAGEKGRGTSQA